MTKLKKFTGREFIDPLEMQVFPWKDLVLSRTEETKGIQIGKNNKSKGQFKKNAIKTSKVIYGTALLFTNPLIFTLIKSKELMEVAGFLSRGDFNSVKLLFSGQKKTEEVVEQALAMYERGDIDGAITLIEDFDNELELIGHNRFRVELLKLNSQFKSQKTLFLSAAIDLITAATLSQSSDTIETEEDDYVSAKGKLYCSAILLLRSYIQAHGINDDLKSCVKTFASKAGYFLKQEGEYRSRIGVHFKEKVDLKFVKIPKLFFGKDEKSKALNELISSNLEKLADEINNIYEPDRAVTWLKNGRYSDIQSEGGILDFLDSVEKLYNEAELVEFVEDKIELMYQKFKAKTEGEVYECVSLSQARFLITRENHIEALALLLNIMDNSTKLNPYVLAQIDRARFALPLLEQQELAQMLAQNKLVSDEVKEYFSFSSGLNSEVRARNPLLNVFYSTKSELVLAGLNKLSEEEYQVRYGDTIYDLNYPQIKTLLKARLKANKDLSRLNEIKKIEEQSFEHAGFQKIYRKNQIKEVSVEAGQSFCSKIVGVCEALQDYKVFEIIKYRALGQKVNVGVFGVISSGKSTFVNALLGRELLGANAEVSTNVLTTISDSPKEFAQAYFEEGDTVEIPLSDVGLYTTEQNNPENEKQVSKMQIFANVKAPYAITDVPGIGAFHKRHAGHEMLIKKQLDFTDCMILITTPELGIKEFELELLRKSVEEKKIPTLIVLNKCEGLDEDELEDMEDALRGKLQKANVKDQNLEIIFTSAKLGLYHELRKSEKAAQEGYSLDECEEAANLKYIRSLLGRDIYEQVRHAKQESLVSRLIYEINKIIHELDEEKAFCFQSMQGQREEVAGELDCLENIIRFLVDEGSYEEQQRMLLDRYNFIEPMSLLHDLDMKKLKTGMFEASEETYCKVKEAVQGTYEALKIDKVDGAQANFIKRITADLSSLKRYLGEELYLPEKARSDIQGSNLSIENKWHQKLFNSTEYIQDIGKRVVSDLILADKQQTLAMTSSMLNEYKYLHQILLNKRERLQRTLKMDEREIAIRLEDVNLELEEFKKIKNIIQEVFDEGKLSEIKRSA